MAKIKSEILGYAAVDSGQLLIVDPCYLSEWKDGESDDKKSHYGKACEITLGDKRQGGELLGSGIAGTGVVFCSGWGDGVYPVTAEYGKDGRITSVVVHFE